MNDLTEIKLRAEDFNRLDEPCGSEGTRQFFDVQDCPGNRALKRAGTGHKFIKPYELTLPDGTVIDCKNLEYGNIERCRKELLAGAEEAIIKL